MVRVVSLCDELLRGMCCEIGISQYGKTDILLKLGLFWQGVRCWGYYQTQLPLRLLCYGLSSLSSRVPGDLYAYYLWFHISILNLYYYQVLFQVYSLFAF